MGKYTCGGTESILAGEQKVRELHYGEVYVSTTDARLSQVPKLNNDVKKLISEWRNALCYQVADLA